MRKTFGIIAMLTLISAVFVSCNSDQKEKETTTEEKMKEEVVEMAEEMVEPNMDLSGLEEFGIKYPVQQSDLPYAYDALEPHFDKATMTVHHDKHHAGYTKKTNSALEGKEYQDMALFEIFQNISQYPIFLRNNAGGYYNHELFWKVLTPAESSEFKGEVADAIVEKFGSIEDFQETFNEHAKTQFGSGWAWLSVNAEGELFVSNTPNQDNPLMDIVEKNGIPILCLDVWEHAYYLKYQNKRTDYITEFWNIINWEEVNKRYLEALEITGA